MGTAPFITLALLVLVAAWWCGTLSMVSVMRASMPGTTPAPIWLVRAMRPLSAVFVGLSGALLAARAAFSPPQIAGFAALGIAVGLTADLIWRRVRRRMQNRSQENSERDTTR